MNRGDELGIISLFAAQPEDLQMRCPDCKRKFALVLVKVDVSQIDDYGKIRIFRCKYCG
jgi:hypothetical protein